MEKYIIYNAVPSYDQETAAMDLLKEHPAIIAEDFEKRDAPKAYLVLPKGAGDGKLAAKTADAMPETIICVEAPNNAGMVYQNVSALNQVISGEKPIPSEMNGSNRDMVIPVASLSETKSVCAALPDGTYKNVTVTREMTLLEFINAAGISGEIKAVCMGHPSGAVYGASELDLALETGISYVKIIGTTQCILDELQKIAALYRKETCGRCVFGHEGSAQLSMILNDMVLKKGKTGDVGLMRDLCDILGTQTLCEVGRSLAKTVLDVTEKFREEIEAHLVKKTCPTGVCTKFVTYHILAAKCSGCTDCMDECEEGAILGKKRFVHVINQEDCTQCGACLSVCEEGAIEKAGAVKPRCPAKPIPCKR